MKVVKLTTLLAGACLYVSSTQAATSEEVVVTGTRTPLAVDKLAASTSIISRADIELLQVNSLPNLLKGITGIDVTVSGGYGKTTGVRMRGTESDHVLVLIDGVRIGSATLGTAAFQDIPVSQIERIEIVRGPRSSLWGSEALGGVIHIFTRKGSGDTPRYTLDAGTSSYDTYKVTGGVSGEYSNFQYSGAVSYFDSQGFDARTQTPGTFEFSQPDKDGYDNISLHFRGCYRFGETAEIDAFILRAQGENQFDGTFQDKTDFVRQVAGGSISLSLFDVWQTQLLLSESRDNSENYAPNNSLASIFDSRRRQLSWQNDVSLTGKQDVSLGLDYREDEISSTTAYPQTSRDNLGVFAQYSGNFKEHQIVASVRLDDDEVFGSKTTGGVGWSYVRQDWLRMYASYSTAYKVPTFNELFFLFFGNPDLGPESADSYEVGLEGQHEWLSWSVRSYFTKVEDMIVTVFDPVMFTFTPQNVNEAEILGFEGELSFQWNDCDAVLTMEYLKPEDETAGQRLPRRTKKRMSLDVSREFDKFSFGGWLLVEGDRFNDAGNTVMVGGYATIDLRADYKFNDQFTFRAKVANLLDKDYQTVDTYNSLGRNFFLSVHYQSR